MHVYFKYRDSSPAIVDRSTYNPLCAGTLNIRIPHTKQIVERIRLWVLGQQVLNQQSGTIFFLKKKQLADINTVHHQDVLCTV